MSLKTVFLDVGNTLLSERSTRAQIYAAAAADFGIAVEREAMEELMRAGHQGLQRVTNGAFRYSDAWFEVYIRRIFVDGLGLPAEQLPELSRGLFERFCDPRTFRFFPGALGLLEELRAAGLSVGVVSNWSAHLPTLLERMGVADRIDFIVCSAIERCEKPEPRIFELALARAGTPPERTLHAGDDPEKDVLGARAVGIEGVLVDHADGMAGTDLPRVTSLPELGHLIRKRIA